LENRRPTVALDWGVVDNGEMPLTVLTSHENFGRSDMLAARNTLALNLTANAHIHLVKENSMPALKWIGYLCFLFAVADFGLSWVDIDLTGVSWSPIVAVIAGSVFVRLGGGDE
jgi:hypothetical protein